MYVSPRIVFQVRTITRALSRTHAPIFLTEGKVPLWREYLSIRLQGRFKEVVWPLEIFAPAP